MSTKKHQSYYMVIPAEVWDANITARAMILYGHISVLANKKKYCYANNSYFEKVMNSSTSSIARAMKELEDNNLIRRELIYKEGSKEIEERKIFLNIGIITGESSPIVTDDNSPVVTDDQDNNTRNNNTRSNIIDVPSDEWVEVWSVWVQYKKDEHRFKFKSINTEQTAFNHLLKLSNNNIQDAKQIINNSIVNGYKGLFELKNKSINKPDTKTLNKDATNYGNF